MESTKTALELAGQDWNIFETRSGGWQLQSLVNGGALINYMTNPNPLNWGEAGKPYQVNCKGIHNFKTLKEALLYVSQAHA